MVLVVLAVSKMEVMSVTIVVNMFVVMLVAVVVHMLDVMLDSAVVDMLVAMSVSVIGGMLDAKVLSFAGDMLVVMSVSFFGCHGGSEAFELRLDFTRWFVGVAEEIDEIWFFGHSLGEGRPAFLTRHLSGTKK